MKQISRFLALVLLMGTLSPSLHGCRWLPESLPAGSSLPTAPTASARPSPSLSDTQLYKKVYGQCVDLRYSYDSEAAALEAFTPVQRLVYILGVYDMEVLCGGLSGFLINSGSLAPYVEENLAILGAEEHRQLFAQYIADNEINVYGLESGSASSILDYLALVEEYDTEDFDGRYVALPPLQDLLTAYIQEHIEEFP